MRYLDTSLLVAAFTNEVATARVQAWLGEQSQDGLSISEWVVTEFSSALSIKMRCGQIAASDRAEALASFTRLAERSLNVIPISATHFRTAARFADQYVLGLRAGDALHLAIAEERGATLCTLDRRLAEAGLALGVNTVIA
ncbi:MAG: type II toxin-antitoxin system VapC family toxin [Alphaproteobacteria bacterium]|nr:type II toxin-antitoxin system VapC family toxin [Alphaproteobacteria bacterium]